MFGEFRDLSRGEMVRCRTRLGAHPRPPPHCRSSASPATRVRPHHPAPRRHRLRAAAERSAADTHDAPERRRPSRASRGPPTKSTRRTSRGRRRAPAPARDAAPAAGRAAAAAPAPAAGRPLGRLRPRRRRLVAQRHQPAERPDVGGAVGADRDRRVVVVEAEALAGEALVDASGPCGSRAPSGTRRRRSVGALRVLRVRVDEPVASESFGTTDGARSSERHAEWQPPPRVEVDALEPRRGRPALLGRGRPGVAVVVLHDERAAGPDQRLVGRARALREHRLPADRARPVDAPAAL